MTFQIGLMAVNAETRHRVGRDAWWLTAWWIVVGVAFSALMLEIVGLRSPLWRYPLTAVVMYALGVVVGMRVWLAFFSRAARAAPERYRGAAADEPEAPSPLSVRTGVVATIILAPGTVVAVLQLMRLFDFSRAILVVVFVAGAITAFVGWLCSRLPMGLGSEAVMSELAMQYIFGRQVGRDFLRPDAPAESWSMIVRETWVQGLVWLLLSAAFGATLAIAHPGAVSLRDLVP